MKIITFFLIFTTMLYSVDKIPKAEVNSYPFIKNSDLTKKYQVNITSSHNFFYWDNQRENLESIDWLPNNYNFQLGLDYYFLFYNALTFRLSYTSKYKELYLTSGYKLNLYTFFYLKSELITQFFSDRFQENYKDENGIERFQSDSFFRGWDIGASISLGMEFNTIDHIQILFYPLVLDMLIFNSRNITSFYWRSYFGVGYYF